MRIPNGHTTTKQTRTKAEECRLGSNVIIVQMPVRSSGSDSCQAGWATTVHLASQEFGTEIRTGICIAIIERTKTSSVALFNIPPSLLYPWNETVSNSELNSEVHSHRYLEHNIEDNILARYVYANQTSLFQVRFGAKFKHVVDDERRVFLCGFEFRSFWVYLAFGGDFFGHELVAECSENSLVECRNWHCECHAWFEIKSWYGDIKPSLYVDISPMCDMKGMVKLPTLQPVLIWERFISLSKANRSEKLRQFLVDFLHFFCNLSYRFA